MRTQVTCGAPLARAVSWVGCGENVMVSASQQWTVPPTWLRQRCAVHPMLRDKLPGITACRVPCSSSQGARPPVAQVLAIVQVIWVAQGSTVAPL